MGFCSYGHPFSLSTSLSNSTPTASLQFPHHTVHSTCKIQKESKIIFFSPLPLFSLHFLFPQLVLGNTSKTDYQFFKTPGHLSYPQEPRGSDLEEAYIFCPLWICPVDIRVEEAGKNLFYRRLLDCQRTPKLLLSLCLSVYFDYIVNGILYKLAVVNYSLIRHQW